MDKNQQTEQTTTRKAQIHSYSMKNSVCPSLFWRMSGNVHCIFCFRVPLIAPSRFLRQLLVGFCFYSFTTALKLTVCLRCSFWTLSHTRDCDKSFLVHIIFSRDLKTEPNPAWQPFCSSWTLLLHSLLSPLQHWSCCSGEMVFLL